MKIIKFKKMSKLELLMFVFTLSFYILFMTFTTYIFIHQNFKGIYWKFIMMPGLSMVMFLQGLNNLIKKDASSKVLAWLSFGVGIFILLMFFTTIRFIHY